MDWKLAAPGPLRKVGLAPIPQKQTGMLVPRPVPATQGFTLLKIDGWDSPGPHGLG